MNEPTRIPKYVKDKIRQAKQGDLYSSFTVSEYYYDGEVLERDIEQSELYLRNVSRIINNAKIRLRNISLYDYKKFSKLKFTSSEKIQRSLLVITVPEKVLSLNLYPNAYNFFLITSESKIITTTNSKIQKLISIQ